MSVGSTVKLKQLNKKTIQEILSEFRIHNADVVLREDPDIDRFIDGLKTNRVYVPSLIVVNKCDLINVQRAQELRKTFSGSVLVSAQQRKGVEEFKKKVWEKLGLLRIYLKAIGKNPDKEEPLIMKRGSTIEDVAKKINRNWEGNLKYARIWGKSAKFGGQALGSDHKLEDEDIVELHF